MRRNVRVLAVIGALVVGACGSEAGPAPQLAKMSSGTYRVAYGAGYDAANPDPVLGTTFRLDRAAGTLTVIAPGGAEVALTFTPRPQSAWAADCFTNASHVLEEVADLAPAPLRIASMTFTTPVVYAKCDASRVILSDRLDDPSNYLALDLQP